MLIKGGQPCDTCGSSDALAQYDNGTYCFSCGKNTRVGYTCPFIQNTTVKETPHSIPIVPGSLVDCFLKQRHFTDELIFQYDLRQTLDGNSLVVSWEDGSIEVRNVNKLLQHLPKYVAIGNKDQFYGYVFCNHIYTIFVEDALSAIRLNSLNINCVALRGTKLSEKMLQTLCQLPDNHKIVTWFDNDEAGFRATKKFLHKLNWCNFKHTNIITEKDPKWYTNTELKEILEAYHVI